MATMSESGVEEGDYESDSDGASALALRRREASDDDERGMVQDAASSADDDASRQPFSDDEGEGEGIPLVDEDEEEEDDDGEGFLRRRRKGSDEEDDGEADSEGLQGPSEGGQELGHVKKSGEDPGGAQETSVAVTTESKEVIEEERKEAEPFVVPTAGAFYMHDDRFRENGGARARRSMGGRKLWEAKDEKPWLHDMFEELSVRNETFQLEGPQRGGRGRSRARGRGREWGRGWAGRLASDSEDVAETRGRRGRGRGRGSRAKVVDSIRAEEPVAAANTYVIKALQDAPASSSSDPQQLSKQPEAPIPLKKPVTGSYLSSASPPFFPSGALQQKLLEGSDANNASWSQSNKGRERDLPHTAVGGRNATGRATTPPVAFVAKPVAGSGRGMSAGGPNSSGHGQGDGLLPTNTQQKQPAQAPIPPQQGKVLPPLLGVPSSTKGSSSQAQVVQSPQPQAQTQQLQQPQASVRASPRSSPGNVGQPVRYKGNSGRGGRSGNYQVVGGSGNSYMYNGGPTAGASSGLRIGDPGFSRPVAPVAVQYGGQAQAGMAVSAVGMALPNYSGQPQYGFPNSELTWVPVLAGGGTLGAGYPSPYMAVEGTPSAMYYTQPAAQPASFHPPGRGELNGTKPSGLWKPPPSQILEQMNLDNAKVNHADTQK